jgi:hypothetical protein
MRCVTLLAFLVFADAARAQPTELYRCGGFPDCGARGFGFTDNCASFEIPVDRDLYYPLKNVGPIKIELHTVLVSLDLPLYVEIVPIPDSLSQSVCAAGLPGFVVAIARGVQACGGGLETFGPFDITSVVPLGGTYGLQLEAFFTNDGDHGFYPPGIGCIRVTPMLMQAQTVSWGLVKTRYR